MRNITDVDAAGGVLRRSQIKPVYDATVPYWRTELHPIDDHRSTEELPEECDIAIIGAGFSGVATAYHLDKLHDGKERPSIVMLEARRVCEGATGRNGGHVKMKTATVHGLIEKFGTELAMEVRDLVMAQNYALKDAVETENLDCEFELRRSYDVYIDEDEAEKAKKDFLANLKAGARWTRDVDMIEGKNIEQVTSIKGAKLALSVPICSLWPYKFVSQILARLVERKAVNLQTNTPVTSVDSTSPRHPSASIIHTPRGTLKAKKLIFATNAYTAGICPSYHETITPVRGTASHLVPSNLISPHLSHTYNINYARPSPTSKSRVDYLNPRPDGSIVVGGGNWTYSNSLSKWYDNFDDSTQLSEARPHFDSLMQRHFKGWEESGAGVERVWTGIQGYTPDGLAHVGEVPGKEGRQWILAGFNGGGNAFIWLTAKGVVEMVANGKDFEDTGLPKLFKTTEERLRQRME
ncbi:uncharacterized protein LTR77_004754 [Saxophila tyrrhenica]|uniref:FAD dependent oxidoreductase domain-containing protein n=1 Tax=Saxophila tyrrhenica TaxID=1690608 RepID=A0AAV9PAB6_9PEZI|nr:hypothetical protein LTR77_004754 [Saxophila tyrrhenica]